MPQIAAAPVLTAPGMRSAARRAALLLVPVLLGVPLAGCNAIYEDTKGWATRLEASLLDTAHELTEPSADAAIEPETVRPVAAGKPGGTVPPPAVPVEPVATVALAAPEPQPVTKRSAAGAEDSTAAGKATATGNATPAGSGAPQGLMAAASEALLTDKSEAPAEAKAAEAAAPPPTPKPKPEALASTKAADDAGVAAVLHLSSLRSEEAARRQWSDLQHSFPEPLGQLQAEFQRTDLGDKGTFYRVIAGPLPSPDEAAQVCAAVKAKDVKQYCRVLPSKPKA